MSCNSCGSASACSCSSVIIPVGPIGPQGAQGIQGPVGSIGPTGLTGPIGPAGATPAKYASTATVVSNTPIVITKAAIIACNPLLSTCISTPLDLDFSITCWFLSAGSQWVLLQPSSIGPGVGQFTAVYDTAGNNITLSFGVTGQVRVVIFG